MKSPKGFRGKYFSLAAILALSTTITLANEVQSVASVQENVTTQEEFSESEELTPSAEELDVVVVSKKIKTKKSEVYSASKSNVSTTNITDNVNILTSEEMKLQGFVTVRDALNSQPGISVTSNGGLGQTTSIYIQGFKNQYTLVLVDGVRYNDPTNTSGARLETLLVDDIEKIEIIKGSQSGVWGADAAAGVINIITKKATPGTHANVGSEIGSYGHRSFSTSISHRTKEFDAILSVLRTTEDGFTSYMPKGDDLDNYEDDSFRNTTINFKSGYWLNADNRIEIGYHDINSLVEYDQDYMDGNSIGRSDYRSQSGYLKYKYFIGKHSLEATLTDSQFDYKSLDTTWGINQTIGSTPSFEIKDTWKYGKDNQLVFGTSYEEREVSYTQVGTDKESTEDRDRALFANNLFRYKNFVFSQALRYDSFSDFDDKITGKLGVKYLISNDFNLYANYGTAYKTPNIMDMINIWGLSNFDLKPENIKSFNAGIEFQGLHVNYFRNEIEDMILWNNDTWQNENIEGTSVLKGIELSYQKTFFEKLLVGANYTYTDAKDKDGNRLKKVPRYQVGLNASYSPIKTLTLSANGEYIGSRKEGTDDTGRYFVANAKVDYKINNIFSTYVKVNNLFDKEYQTTYGYATPRRSYYLGFNAKF